MGTRKKMRKLEVYNSTLKDKIRVDQGIIIKLQNEIETVSLVIISKYKKVSLRKANE